MPATTIRTPSTTQPVPLELAKQYLRVDSGNAQDAVITLLLAAAADFVEQYTGRVLTTRELETTFLLGEEYALPVQPAGAPTAVTGALTDLADLARGYSEDYRKGIIVSRDYPLGDAGFYGLGALSYTVTYPAGYADGACPAALQMGVLKVLSELYENRENTVDGRVAPVSVGVKEILGPWRVQPLLL